MEIEYELTVADVKALLRFNKKNGPKLKQHPLLEGMLLGLGVAIVVLLFLPSWFSGLPLRDWLTGFCNGVIAGILIMVAFAFLLARVGEANTLHHYFKEEGRWLWARRRLQITADGFQIVNEFQQSRYSWSVVWLIESTDEHAFFYTTLQAATIIPRRVFQNRRDFETIIDLACRYHKSLPSRESIATEILDALPAEQTGITLPRQP